ncbi:MAG: carboxyltransferase domain-containing protein [Myxococcales bacterium]|nr:urea amidolyase family protein [Myxococcales bacterium]
MRRLTDGAVLVELPNEDALALALALAKERPEGFLDAVPGARTLLVMFEPGRFDLAVLSKPMPASARTVSRIVKLPAVYDGPDLPDLGPDAVRRHVDAEHVVAFLGFAPGFAYMTGGFDVPRLKTPRVRVPSGSLAVADGYTGVYPAETPGGWRLIGRVGARMFDPDATPPALLRPGDRVVFEPVDELPARSIDSSARPKGMPILRVIAPGPFTTVQGAPRYGLASSGVPAGGAFDPAALAEMNALVGNPPLAAGLELTISGPGLRALEDVRLAFMGRVETLRKGQQVKVGMMRERARGYVAVEGGLATELVTRPLQAGDDLIRAEAETVSNAPLRRAQTAGSLLEIRAVPGPQLDHFREPLAFFRNEYTLSPQSDRRGLRLRGPALEVVEPDVEPEGTALGAVQVPGDGLPIVLGPDRPVTGGYPKIATVLSADLPLLAQARPGARIRFREVRP